MTQGGLVGFGLDAQHADRYPGGMLGLVEKWRERLSHLSIVSLERVEEAIEFRQKYAQQLPVVHHLSGVAPADPGGPHLDRLAQLDEITEALGAVWCGEDIGLWTIGPYAIPYFAPPLFESEFAQQIGLRIQSMSRSGRPPFLAEIPSCSIAIGSMDMGSFFHSLTDTADCELVLDVSHVYSYALLTGRDPLEVQRSLPLGRVREAHIAGGRVDAAYPHRYIDTHSDKILPEVMSLLADAAVNCPRLAAVTFEIGIGLTGSQIQKSFEDVQACLERVGWAPGFPDHEI